GIIGFPPGSQRAIMCQFAAYQPEKPPLSRRTIGRRVMFRDHVPFYFAWGCFRYFVSGACGAPPRCLQRQARATACGNRISISVPERPPVLIWNLARLASTSALVSDRLTVELSAPSDGAAGRNGCSAAATSLSLRPWPVSRTRSTTSPKSDSAVETMTWPPAL